MTIDIPPGIILVEDDDIDRMVVTRAFAKNNIKNPLHIARDGEEALDMLKGLNGKEKLDPLPKIMLLDINMPRMNGLELLREIRHDEELQTISVFMLTTSKDDQDRLEAYKNNVAGYIIKPVSFDKLVEAIAVLNTYWNLSVLPA
ncbi:MAG: response regulator [Bacteroidetes bacterium]|nr:response regulator [Bacteroidota bacterium]MBX7239021.1 response regulator [Bacteroidia bacterium]MCW5919614.1 response regulator [Bacteroidota bacterium]HMU78357.1 response regulator [Bacteroidia bacterium]HMX97451.1 response regulator [Bacteroidia bacterium]